MTFVPRAAVPHNTLARGAGGRMLLCALLPATAGACGGEDFMRPNDFRPPDVTIVDPAEGEFVSSRPAFTIRFSDDNTGVFCPSTSATIEGRDYSQFFRNGCNQAAGEIRVPGGQINPPLEEGGARLRFQILDQAGNQATVTRAFVVNPPGGGGGGPPDL